MIYYLIYTSKATELMNESQLKDVLKQSRMRNKTLGITGMLLYVEGQFINKLNRKLIRTLNGRFIQVLEGKEADVKFVYKSLQTDSRHYDLMILKENVILERNFKNWEMGFRQIGADNSKNLKEFIDVEKLLPDLDSIEEINEPLNFIMSFYQMSKNNT